MVFNWFLGVFKVVIHRLLLRVLQWLFMACLGFKFWLLIGRLIRERIGCSLVV